MSHAIDALIHEAEHLTEMAERSAKYVTQTEGSLEREREALRRCRDARTDVIDKLRTLGAHEAADKLEEPPPT